MMNIKSVSVLRLLSEYGDPQQVAEHQKEARALLHRVGTIKATVETPQTIVASASTSLGVPCSSGERDYIKALAIDLLRTHQVCAGIEKQMAKVTEEREDLTELVALCGKVTTVVLVSLLGDLREYDSANSLLNAMGLNLKEHSSGKYKSQLSITKRGSGKVRYYLYWLSLRLIQKDPLVKMWYERKVARDGGRNKKRALVAVMRKVVKSLCYVAKGEAFDSQKLFNTKHLALLEK